ncbi:MAG: PTS transporter subunit EIIC [Lachnospiraceae bacterium]
MKNFAGSTFEYLQRLGRSLFLPISLLPIAGLLLGLGSSFTNESTIATYHLASLLGEGTILHSLLVVMYNVGNLILSNLALLFGMAIALGMAKQEKAVAVLSAAISFLVMHAAINTTLTLTGRILPDGSIASSVTDGTITTVLGITTLQMGVFAGIIVGIVVSVLHNKFYKIQLPDAFAFFSGTRFVPIICTLSFTVIGIAATFIWPYVQAGIYALGDVINSTGNFGIFLYGALERLLIPFGLHHIINTTMWQTALGGKLVVDGVEVLGCQNIFFAELASSSVTRFSLAGTQFMAGKYAFMIAGLPAACLAMYKCAKPENKKVVGSMLLSAAITSIVTGVTEPIEFTFLFVAPILYGVHIILSGLAFVIFAVLKITIGQTFSCGLIDFILYGVLPGQAKSNWMMAVPVLILYFILYYAVFYFCINKFNLKTPGREDAENKLYTKADYQAKTSRKSISQTSGQPADTGDAVLNETIIEGLGGLDNIQTINNCATRLRVRLHDINLADESLLKSTGANGCIKKGSEIQVIYGPKVAVIKSNLVEYIHTIMPEKTV